MALRDRIAAHRPDVAKIVTKSGSTEDALRVLELVGSSRLPLAAHALGPAGIATRVLGARLGSAIVYGSARPGSEGAPGQPSLRSLLREIDGMIALETVEYPELDRWKGDTLDLVNLAQSMDS